mgnify:CR=1 FL=1
MNIALLVSGSLGFNVLNYLVLQERQIQCVFTDSKSTNIITLANFKRIPLYTGNPRSRYSIEFIRPFKIELMLSVNYLFIIERDLYSRSKFAINLHGSLLPKYRGRTPHVWAIINNEDYTGITAHLIDDGCDTGDIIKQWEVPIDYHDTGADILNKFHELYLPLVDSLIQEYQKGQLHAIPQNHAKSTYFCKRTTSDGIIDWNWHKERIRNWVRAQAKPYPGAFTFYEKEKLIVDEIKFVDCGYQQNDINGLLLSSNPFYVKTPNGVVHLSKIRSDNTLPTLEAGKKLG